LRFGGCRLATSTRLREGGHALQKQAPGARARSWSQSDGTHVSMMPQAFPDPSSSGTGWPRSRCGCRCRIRPPRHIRRASRRRRSSAAVTLPRMGHLRCSIIPRFKPEGTPKRNNSICHVMKPIQECPGLSFVWLPSTQPWTFCLCSGCNRSKAAVDCQGDLFRRQHETACDLHP